MNKSNLYNENCYDNVLQNQPFNANKLNQIFTNTVFQV